MKFSQQVYFTILRTQTSPACWRKMKGSNRVHSATDRIYFAPFMPKLARAINRREKNRGSMTYNTDRLTERLQISDAHRKQIESL